MIRSLKSAAAALLALPAVLVAAELQAQQNPVHTHVGHVSTGFAAAPDGAGLLATAKAEAEVAAQHAGFAARDLTNLGGMKNHAGHVLHALDPAEGSQGPGKGFGVKRAAEAVAAHIGMAAGAQGASQNVTTHAGHIAASATTTAQRATRAAELARRIQASDNYTDAGALVEQLQVLTQQILAGHDADGNGTIGWQEGEGGIAQAEQHLGLLTRAEGM